MKVYSPCLNQKQINILELKNLDPEVFQLKNIKNQKKDIAEVDQRVKKDLDLIAKKRKFQINKII